MHGFDKTTPCIDNIHKIRQKLIKVSPGKVGLACMFVRDTTSYPGPSLNLGEAKQGEISF